MDWLKTTDRAIHSGFEGNFEAMLGTKIMQTVMVVMVGSFFCRGTLGVELAFLHTRECPPRGQQEEESGLIRTHHLGSKILSNPSCGFGENLLDELKIIWSPGGVCTMNFFYQIIQRLLKQFQKKKSTISRWFEKPGGTLVRISGGPTLPKLSIQPQLNIWHNFSPRKSGIHMSGQDCL